MPCFSLAHALNEDINGTVDPRVSKITHGVSDDYGNVIVVAFAERDGGA